MNILENVGAEPVHGIGFAVVANDEPVGWCAIIHRTSRTRGECQQRREDLSKLHDGELYSPLLHGVPRSARVLLGSPIDTVSDRPCLAGTLTVPERSEGHLIRNAMRSEDLH